MHVYGRPGYGLLCRPIAFHLVVKVSQTLRGSAYGTGVHSLWPYSVLNRIARNELEYTLNCKYRSEDVHDMLVEGFVPVSKQSDKMCHKRLESAPSKLSLSLWSVNAQKTVKDSYKGDCG